MNNLDKHELIDKFLSKQLSETEKVIFNDLIKNDKDFSKEVDKIRSANNAIHQLGLLRTSKKLDQIHKKNTQFKYRMWVTGAITTIIILLGTYGIYNTKSNTTNDLSPQTPITSKTQTFEATKTTEPTANEQSQKAITVEINKETVSSIHTKDIKNKPDNSTTITKTYDTTTKIKTIANNRFIDTITPIVSKKKETALIPEKSYKTTIICNDIVLSKNRTSASCIGKQNGEIIYSNSSFSGGVSPYRSYIYRLGNDENVFVKNQLAAGQYLIKVIDAYECVDTIHNITISEKRCIQRIDYNFSPKYGEVWEYPQLGESSRLTLIIKDMSNFTVLEKQISFDEESSWDGTLENGGIIKKGVYLVEIKSNHETSAVGTLTIIE